MKPTKTQAGAPHKNCSNCHFFLQTSSRNSGSRGTQLIGYCRANPPIPYFELDTSNPDEHGQFPLVPKIGRFPVVLDNMWCGSFDYKDETPAVGGSLATRREIA